MSKKIIIALLIASTLFISSVSAYVRTRSYVRRSTGKYVMPHYKTSPNKTKMDNWSTKGNVNPYTGHKGHKNPFTGKN